MERLREMLRLPVRVPRAIIWISRKPTNSYYHQRFILNQDDVVRKLTEVYGAERVVLFDHKQYTLDETIELFASAKAIIGAHGGGLYNQFFASKSCIIVEIMPVRANGLYPDQRSASEEPSFSHMAVWSNSLLIGQEFWRYYVMTNGQNFRVNVSDFMQFLAGIAQLGD
jgi:capsular polysaccharide biosynthesis protein